MRYGMWEAWNSLELASSEISEIHGFGLSSVHSLVSTCWHFLIGIGISSLFLLNSHTFFLATHINIAAAHRCETHSQITTLVHVRIYSCEWLIWKWHILVRYVLIAGDTCVLVNALSHIQRLWCEWTFLHVLWGKCGHWSLTLLFGQI